MDNKWISELKSGDKVIFHIWSWNYSNYYEETVQKITPKGFVKVNDILFDPVYGRARGDNRCCIENPNDEEVMEKLEKNKKERFVKSVFYKMEKIKSLTYEQAVKIDNVLNEVQQK